MKTKLTLKLIFVLLLSACQTTHISEKQAAQIQDEIKQSVTDYSEALTRLDIEKAKEFYIQTEEILLSMDGNIIAGQKDVDTFLNDFSKSIKQMSKIETYNIHIALLSREAATFTMEFRWNAITQQNDTLNMRGTATYAMKKSENRWRVVHLVGFHTPVDKK